MKIDFLKAAADIRKAFCKGDLGTYQFSQGPVCARGAFLRQIYFRSRLEFYSGSRSPAVIEADAKLAKIVREQYPDRLSKRRDDEYGDRNAWDVVLFNNHPDTTAEEVALMMEKAAAE